MICLQIKGIEKTNFVCPCVRLQSFTCRRPYLFHYRYMLWLLLSWGLSAGGPCRASPLRTTVQLAPRPYQGQVVNEAHEPLSGATVLVRGTVTAVSTNADGRFLLHLPSGEHTLVVDYPGCRSRTVPVMRPDSVLVVVLSNTLAPRRR